MCDTVSGVNTYDNNNNDSSSRDGADATQHDDDDDGVGSNFAIVYANAEMVVVNKPPDVRMDGDESDADTDDGDAGKAVSQARRTPPRTVAQWAYAYMRVHGIVAASAAAVSSSSSPSRLQLQRALKFVHQLDYGTSGVLCLAFSKDMAARLAHCFEMRTSHKLYVARVHGHVPDYNTHANNNNNNNNSVQSSSSSSSDFDVWLRQHPLAYSSTRGRGIRVVAVDAEERAAYAARLQRMCISGSNNNTCTHDNDSSSSSSDGCGACADVHTTHGLASPAAHALYTRVCAFLSAQQRCIEVDLPVGDDVSDTSRQFRMAVDVGDVQRSDNDSGDACSCRVRGARASVTRLFVLSRQTHPHPTSGRACATTTLLLQPRTGRRHQLRVHCHALGFPIVGDVLYATVPLYTRNTTQESIRSSSSAAVTTATAAMTCDMSQWPRMYLHAWLLRLPCDVAPAADARARAQDKRKRRRETRGLVTTSTQRSNVCRGDGDSEAAAVAALPWIEFVATVPFAL